MLLLSHYHEFCSMRNVVIWSYATGATSMTHMTAYERTLVIELTVCACAPNMLCARLADPSALSIADNVIKADVLRVICQHQSARCTQPIALRWMCVCVCVCVHRQSCCRLSTMLIVAPAANPRHVWVAGVQHVHVLISAVCIADASECNDRQIFPNYPLIHTHIFDTQVNLRIPV